MPISVAEIAGSSFMVRKIKSEREERIPVFDVRYSEGNIYFLTYKNNKWSLVDANDYEYIAKRFLRSEE